MTELHRTAPEFRQPPGVIAPAPLHLDDVVFEPQPNGIVERATRAGAIIGDVLMDRIPRDGAPDIVDIVWFARKVDQHGSFSDWKPMRSVHEARAFLVSRRRD